MPSFDNQIHYTKFLIIKKIFYKAISRIHLNKLSCSNYVFNDKSCYNTEFGNNKTYGKRK